MSRVRALVARHPGRHTRAALRRAAAAAPERTTSDPGAPQSISRYGLSYEEIV